jgi:transposase
VEGRLFAHRRDLLTRLDLVFMDTTSLYFEGAGGQTLGRHGYSKDHRPDLRQMILAVSIDGDGRPVCSEMWLGNSADVTTLIPVIDRLRRRFDIARVCVVADRGMISAETMAELEARRLLYILGVRERSDKLVRELVLDDPAPFLSLVISKRGKEIDYDDRHRARGCVDRAPRPAPAGRRDGMPAPGRMADGRSNAPAGGNVRPAVCRRRASRAA